MSENFFDVLGVKPMLGRGFNAQETAWKGPKAVMLGYPIWERRFNRDPKIVGTALIINDEPHTVVGVLPASFDFATVFAPGSRFDLYFPFPLSPETNRWGNTMAMIGRLKGGATPAGAHAEIRALAPQIVREHPERNNFEGIVRPLSEQISGNVRLAAWVLAGAVGMVMLIVCANLSNLLLARTAARQKEVAIRMALGAGRRRLLAQLLTEGLVLSCSGAVLGLLIALGGTRLLTQLDAVSIPLLRDVRTDGAALGFAVILALVTGLVFGVAPALQASGVGDDQRAEGCEPRIDRRPRPHLGAQRPRRVGGRLRLRAARRRRPADSQPDQRARREDGLRAGARGDDPRRPRQPCHDARPARRLLRRGAPAREGGAGHRERGDHRYAAARPQPHLGRRRAGRDLRARQVSVGLRARRVRGLPGRDGRAGAGRTRPRRQRHGRQGAGHAREQDAGRRAVARSRIPIGKYVRGGCSKEGRRVVGVVGDVRHLSLEQASGNEMYIPARQCDDLAGAYLVVRSTLPPGQLAGTLRAALGPVTGTLASNDFRTLQQLVDKSVSPRRFTVLLLGGFAVFALVLASLGIYALISYSVNQRTQEIGIRMALGASARDVQARIVGQTLRLAAIGMVIGAACSWLLVRGAASLLFGVTPRDPQTFLGMAVVLTTVALVAGYLPARRASRIDPMVALRAE